jgi:polyhydroxyalkanoate synthesis repressor PhaR
VGEERIVKKYPNRRLYDTSDSRYIALDDIRQLVLEDRSFRVVDAKSGADITRSILLQIIVDQEEKGQPILSAQLLRKIIRFYGDAMQMFMSSYLDRSVDWFVEQQAEVYKQMASVMGKAPAATFQEMTRKNLELWEQMQKGMLDAYGLAKSRGKDEKE